MSSFHHLMFGSVRGMQASSERGMQETSIDTQPCEAQSRMSQALILIMMSLVTTSPQYQIV